TSWFGTAGITYTPRAFQTPLGEFSPYVETAWRSYSSRSSDFLFFSDASASVLVSTGIRWRVEVSN
ncbi:MAG: hypothetical protein FWC97_09195, partial [Treponema sp.]|nr:hypothetical protein [Treponema sp.]